MKKLRLMLWGLAVVAGLSYLAIMNFGTPYETQSRIDKDELGVAGLQITPHFALTNHKGAKVTHEDYADQYMFVYFGFTSCPAVCPTELQRIATVINDLPEELAERVRPVFITVDPERDTVQAMAEYVALFHPRMDGLTGSVDEVKKVLNDWAVFATKVDDPNFTEYTMDHSSYLYLISPEGELSAIFRPKDTVEAMTQRVINKMRGS